MKFTKDQSIKWTTDYDIFKVLPGNRDYTVHGKKLIPSVSVWGVISPLIVNEKMEVIDGQGRLYAAKACGAKVPYIIKKDLNVDACIEMNTTQTKWGYRDYIKSYAEQGNKDYAELQSYIEKYPKLPIYCLWFGLSGGIYAHEAPIKTGAFKVFPRDRRKIVDSLTFMKKLTDNKKIYSHIPGRKHLFFKSVFYALGVDKINKDRIITCLEKYIQNDDIYHPITNEENAVKSLEKAYNYCLESDRKINLIGFFREAQQKQLTWFGKPKREIKEA